MTVGRRTGVRLLRGLFANVVLDMGLCLRLDVLVDAREAAGVLSCLDLRQPAVVAAVACPHAFVPFETVMSSPRAGAPGRRVGVAIRHVSSRIHVCLLYAHSSPAAVNSALPAVALRPTRPINHASEITGAASSGRIRCPAIRPST